MSTLRLTCLTLLTLSAFAANSLLARAALESGDMGPSEFTLIRLVSGALMLTILWHLSRHSPAQLALDPAVDTPLARTFVARLKSWAGAGALCLYATLFSFAYLKLDTGTGALCLFASVQITILTYAGLNRDLSRQDAIGAAIAFSGFVYLVYPALGTPSALGFFFMTLSGIGWGIYTILGRRTTTPLGHTQTNFWRASLISLPLSLLIFPDPKLSSMGIGLALASGMFASGLGYAIWYSVLPHLKSSLAASLQLLVPPLAAIMGWVVLGETLSLRFWLALAIIIGGLWIVINAKKRRQPEG